MDDNVAALRLSEERLRLIIQNMPVCMDAFDEQGNLVVWNAECERVTGYSAAELVNNPRAMEILYPDQAYRDRMVQQWLERGNDYRDWEWEITAKDGTKKTIAWSNISGRVPIPGWASWSLGVDVTQRKKVEEQIRVGQRRTRAILETALDCIITTDNQGLILEFNPAAEKAFGYARSQVIGKPIAELIIPPEYREKHHAGMKRYLATGIANVLGRRLELPAMRSDGSIFPAEIYITAIEGEGLRTFTANLRDISDRKRTDEEREALLESERAARADAERANRLKDEFLSTLSHELRTPLNAILGWTQLLRTGRLNEMERTQGLEVIERNVRVQAQIIDDLLDMSRIISGKVRLDVQRIAVSPVIEAAIGTVRPAADAKEIRIHAVLDSEAGAVMGDPNRLQQVVWNLLSNAIKFTPKGGRVQVVLRREESHVMIAVSDTGQGIAPEFMPYVFERFRQGDASTTRTHGGLGLGLAIVKQLVELHGGTVSAESPGAGQGATFTVALPIAIVHAGEGPDRRAASKPAIIFNPQQPVLKGVKVLVVDDELDGLALVRRILEESQATVFTATSTDEGLQAFEEHKPDVVLSDIGMPGQDGYQFIRQIRERGVARGGNVPAAAVTAFARSEDRRRAMLAGYQTHVSKPVEPAELVAVVASLAGRTGNFA